MYQAKKHLKKILGLASICIIFINATVPNDDPKLPANSVQLGELLFNDKLFSRDKSVSCGSCHKAEHAFADNAPTSIGVAGMTKRNTPTAAYLNENPHFFWDARAKSLEEQARGPITDKTEMGMTIPEVINRLREDSFYRQAFQRIYKSEPDSVLTVTAIADFQKSLSVYDSPYDRFIKGDEKALSKSAIRGYYLFFQENTCAEPACHGGKNFTKAELVVNGLEDPNDLGVFQRSKIKADMGKFKVPTLRNVAVTAPYMHDGSKKTLREVIEFYNDERNFNRTDKSVIHFRVKHQRTQPLSPTEIDDMVEFLKSLTDNRYAAALK